MPTPNAKLSERLAVVGVLAPVAVTTSELFTGYVPLALLGQILAIANLGNFTADPIDVKIYQAKNGSGDGEKLLKAATQLAAHATDNDSKQILLNARADELDEEFTHVRVGILSGATGGIAGLLVLGGDGRFEPAASLTSVVEVVG